jgi:lipopolysaccharide/colanic/teichoic acid biosynthesis glycosyltransferase
VRYVRRWSLWLDIQILARTVTTVMRDLRPKTRSVSRVTKGISVEEA